jgi:uncharacterized protein
MKPKISSRNDEIMSLIFLIQHPWKVLLVTCLLSGIILNGVAWMQAHAMTHYVAGKERTNKPETLSLVNKIWIILSGVELPRPNNDQTPQTVGLSYERHQIELPNREQIAAWFIPAKDSHGVVLLFPPYGGSKQTLLASSKIFHELDYDTFLVDFRGVGDSTGSDTTLGIREAKDVVKSMNYVQQKWANRPIVLYGASMGSVAIMRSISHEGITPNAIILESPFDRLLSTVKHRFEAMGIPSSPGSELIVFWGGLQQKIDGFAHNPVEYAEKIKCPVLVLYGSDDKRVKLLEVESIIDRISTRRHLAVLSGIGHGSLANDNPLEWKQKVEKFLKDN